MRLNTDGYGASTFHAGSYFYKGREYRSLAKSQGMWVILSIYRSQEGNARNQRAIQRYGLKVDSLAKVETIPVGQKQRVEILKVLYRGARLIILDEPTAVLTPQETDELFVSIKAHYKEGYVPSSSLRQIARSDGNSRIG